MSLPGVLFFIASLALPASLPAAVEFFQDNFANDVAPDSDGINGFWTVSAPANSTIVETDGTVAFTSGGPASPNGTIAAYLFSGAPDSRFNFFTRRLRFSAQVSVGGSSPAGQSLFRFTLAGAAGSGYNNDDALTLALRADNVFSLSAKQDRPATPAESVRKLLEANAGGAITGFDLTLDTRDYVLVIHHQGGAGSSSFTGAHGCIPAQWGVDGDSALQLETTRSTGASAGAGQATLVSVERFSVHRLDPPPVFEDGFDNGIPANSTAENAVWSMSLPDTSAVVENTGKLVQTASSASANTIIANARTAVSSRYNFFDRQFRVSASLRVGGDAAQGYMTQGRLLLASSGTDGLVAPDTLSVGLRGYNDLSLFTKIDGPVVHPDNAANPAVRPLLGTAQDFHVVTFSGEDVVNGFDLTLNATRYRLVGRNGGAGSGLARFSGLHGIDRARWGGGDSSLMLEAIRTGGAAANTRATSTWDNLTVEADASALLDEPWWDFQTTYPGQGTTTITGNFRLWLPATEPVIRGVILIGPGSGGDYRHLVHDPVAQEAARAIGFGLLGYTNAANLNFWTQDTIKIKGAVQAVLDHAASVSGRAELRNAPLCITGNSAGAFDSTFLARHWPERTIAFVAHRGGSYGSTGPVPAAAKKVPGLFMAGSTDSNPSTNPATLKTIFGRWRADGAQVAYAVNWGVGHTMRGNQSWEATWPWIVEVVNLRYPRPLIPPSLPGVLPALVSLSDASGWLGDNASFSASTTPSTTHPFTYVAPAAGYTGVVATASWMPNETCARLYRALTSTDRQARSTVPLHGPLRIVSPAQFMEPVKLGASVSIEVDPREFDNTSPITLMEFFDGDRLIATDTAGPDWSCTFVPPATGLRTLTVVATNTAGATRDALRILHVVPANHPPEAFPLSRTIPAGSAATGSLAHSDPEGDAVSYSVREGPSHGTLTLDAATGAYTYRPAHGYAGPDSFSFSVNDGFSESSAANVTIEITPPADTDTDGMPDAWENLHGVTDPTRDNDGDGFSNLQEYLAFTDPADPADALRIVSLSVGEGTPAPFVLRWSATGGVRYRIQYSDTLSGFTDIIRPPHEEIQAGAHGERGEAEFTDDHSLTPPPASGRRFYRVRVVR